MKKHVFLDEDLCQIRYKGYDVPISQTHCQPVLLAALHVLINKGCAN
jgi:hypothetical protein